MTIPRAMRFEVLRRDGFACSYCGRKPPDVELHIDHVTPEALGGPSTPENLRTACADCNAGKGSTPPDAEMVAQVADDATRWAAAIKRAADEMVESCSRVILCSTSRYGCCNRRLDELYARAAEIVEGDDGET